MTSYANSSTHLRTLTRKSLMKFGVDRDLTVQQMIDLKKYKDLISAYYLLGQINFTEDILNELGIVPELRIAKPGKSKESYYDNVGKILRWCIEKDPNYITWKAKDNTHAEGRARVHSKKIINTPKCIMRDFQQGKLRDY